MERLRLEYDQAGQVRRSLAEIRFELLALVPTTAGAVVALVSPRSTGVELLAIGLLGLAATLGVLVYELRNAELGRSAARRVRRLEEQLLAGGPLVVEPRPVLGGRARPLARGRRSSTARRSPAGATSSHGACSARPGSTTPARSGCRSALSPGSGAGARRRTSRAHAGRRCSAAGARSLDR